MKLTIPIFEKILNKKLPRDLVINNLSIDSRNITKNDVFVAIKGKNEDGNKYAIEALKKGAAFCIIDNEDFIINEKTIMVHDSLLFLKDLGLYIKNKLNLNKTIAITGSVGKTTTKTWANFILNKKKLAFCSIKNYNTIYGTTITLPLFPENVEYAIFEVGTNSIGEISELSSYLNPDIGILTNIYESHIGNFKNKIELANEKISIINGIKKDGFLIYDGDSEFSEYIKQKANEKKLKAFSVGFSENNDFSISCNFKTVCVKTPKENIEFDISVDGKHNAFICALIIALLYCLNENIKDYLTYFKELDAISGRGKITKFIYENKKIQVIDDSYNASPTSVLAALDILEKKDSKQKIAVLGQMAELGEKELFYHQLISKKIAAMDLDKVFFIGNSCLFDVFKNELKEKIECFEQINDFNIEKILKITQNMAIILLKGSRNVGLDAFIKYLKNVL